MKIDKDTAEWAKENLFYFPKMAEKYLKIRTKTGDVLPLAFNDPQKQVWDIYERNEKEGRPHRYIVLKARQEGISTFFSGLVYHRIITGTNKSALIVGHEKSASTNLFNMMKRFETKLPPPLRPAVKASNEQILSYEKLESEISVKTAEGRESLGRSGTIHYALLTEVAFWADIKSSLNAVFQCVPDTKDSLIVLESTANGFNEFYNLWRDAKEGENDFTPIFLGWHMMKEYRINFKNHGALVNFKKTLNKEETELRDTLKIGYAQLNWRRSAIKNKCGGDVNLFRQEYPATDQESFIASGRPVFDINICNENYINSLDPIRIGYLEDGKNGVVFVDDPKGYIKLYKEPDLRHDESYRFAAGADVAEGLASGDFSVCSVFDRKFNEVILSWHGHIDPDLFAREIVKIEKYLGKQVHFCIEQNNHGLTVINRCFDYSVNMYYRVDYNKGRAKSTDNLGFKTTSITKKTIIDRLIEYVRERVFVSREKEFWNECFTFVRDDRGRMQAQGKDKPNSKIYDDRVMAYALMFECDNWLPSFFVKKEPEKRYPGTRDDLRGIDVISGITRF